MIRLAISRRPDELILEWTDEKVSASLKGKIEDVSDDKLEEIKGEFLRAVWGNSVDNLKRAGTQLWELLPLKIADELSIKWESDFPSDMYLEVSDSLVDIPWELLHNGQEFLAEHFNVGKTITGKVYQWKVKPRNLQTPLKTLILSNPEGNADLKRAYDECLAIRGALEQYPDRFDLVTRTGRVNKRLLVRGEILKYDIVLFFGHTKFDYKNRSETGWRFNQSIYGEADIKTTCKYPSPFCAGVIANSCQLPNEPTWQPQGASLCKAFLQAGVSFFIGTYWHIPDNQASQFAAALLDELIIQNKSLGEAVRSTRNTLKKNGLPWRLWAGYTLYGDPSMKIAVESELSEPVRAETAAAAALSFMPEERVAQYTILTKIEEDDPFHVLHKARDPQGENVILGVSYIQDPEIASQELDRMQKLVALDHSNLVRLLAAEQVKTETDAETGKFYIVYEYFENAKTLKQILAEAQANPDGHLPPEKARKYLLQLCKAIQAIHKIGCYHGSLNPKNILVTPDDIIKVNPKNVLNSPEENNKAKGSGVDEPPSAGTASSQLPYAAPEQIARNRDDKRSDIWALGAIAYELFSGRQLFGVDDASADPQASWLEDILMNWPPDLTGILPDIADTLLRSINPRPELRFKNADELAKALENPTPAPVAEKALTALEQDIYNHFRSGCALLALIAEEEDRALRSLSGIAQRLNVPFYEWSSTTGLKLQNGAAENLNDLQVLDWFSLELERPGILVLKDFHPYLQRVEVQRRMSDWYSLRHRRQTPVKTIVFTSPVMILTETLERQVAMFTFPPPDSLEISHMMEEKLMVLPEEQQPPPNQRYDMAWQSRGMALREIECVMDQTLLEPDENFAGGFIQNLAEAKGEIIRKTGLLEFYQPGINLDALGGVDPLRAMLHNVELALQAWTWMPVPRGWLLVGVPGAGKSLAAQAIAGQLKLPLLRLDMGRIYTALQGGAENNMRQAIELCTRLSPVVLWVDEIEKGMGGMTSPTAGGPMSRVLGLLLSWMQERSAPVFIVATANDVSLGLSSPEIFRPGRFDAVLFFDQPGPAGRREIFRVLLNKHMLKPMFKPDYLQNFVEHSDGATGVEIEQAIIDAIYDALSQGRADPTPEDVLASLKRAKNFWIENTAFGRQRNGHIRALAALMGAVQVTS